MARAGAAGRPLWVCPACGERFVSPRLWHSCGRHTYDALFARSDPHVRRIFDRLAAIARACGPVRIYPQKTRVVMQTRIRFVAGYPRRSALLASFLLPRDTSSARFSKTEQYGSRHYFVAYVTLESEAEVDGEMARLMRLAYAIGNQDHLRPAPVRPERGPRR